MFHMLSCFDLKPGENIIDFRGAYADFVAYQMSALTANAAVTVRQRIERYRGGAALGIRSVTGRPVTTIERIHRTVA